MYHSFHHMIFHLYTCILQFCCIHKTLIHKRITLRCNDTSAKHSADIFFQKRRCQRIFLFLFPQILSPRGYTRFLTLYTWSVSVCRHSCHSCRKIAARAVSAHMNIFFVSSIILHIFFCPHQSLVGFFQPLGNFYSGIVSF